MLAVGPQVWTRVSTTVIAAFLASLVECVEALTVVLAVGSVRGWKSALTGTAAALILLGALVAILGRQLSSIPLHGIQLAVGILVLLFGLRWLRKAILRAAGLIPLHDETAAFAKNTAAMRSSLPVHLATLDRTAFSAAFHITMLEGTEVVFIVIALGAGSTGLMAPASLGALAALLTIAGLGFVLHRPLARVPENTLKFVVGVLLSAFGTFWTGEGAGFIWFGGDLAILALASGYLAIALALVAMARQCAVPVEG